MQNKNEKKELMKRTQNNMQEGFTLIEMAIVLLIIGISVGGILMVATPIVEGAKLKETEQKMDRVIDAISVYVQRNNRIPCPSDPNKYAASPAQPYGAEVGSGSSGAQFGDCGDGSGAVEGIVPFRTIGLNEGDVIDGWRNYITYRVSPALAYKTNNAHDAHARCRVDGTWVESGGNNYNPAKARFCCPENSTKGVSTDLIIEDENNAKFWLFTRDTGDYADVDTSVPSDTTFDPANDNVTIPAFVLISHGSNGYGAYEANGSRPNASAGGTSEDQNADNTTVEKRIATYSTAPGTTEFDDVVMWRTQDQIYAETGEGSCATP